MGEDQNKMSNGVNGDQPQMLPQPQKNIWFWIVLGVVSVLALAFAFYNYYSVPVPPEEGVTRSAVPIEGEDVSGIEGELQAEPLEDLDSELGDIEKELAL